MIVITGRKSANGRLGTGCRTRRASVGSRLTVAAVLVLLASRASDAQTAERSGQPTSRPAPVASDSAARALVVAEVHAFYRDLHAARWAAVLDHFWPAKITARWSPPAAAPAWALTDERTDVARSRASGSGRSQPCDGASDSSREVAVSIVGEWAHATAACWADGAHDAPAVDDFWLLRVGTRWKIVHLAR